MLSLYFGLICAVIVTYNTKEINLSNLTKLSKVTNKILIIDNGSSKETLKLLSLIKEKFPMVSIYYNPKNLGLAAAQNIGIKKAIAENFDWILFLDQDSFFQEGSIENFKKYYLSLDQKQRESIAILAPRVFDLNLNSFYAHLIPKWKIFFKKLKCEQKNSIKGVLFAISSGSLIKTEVFKKIGLFREDFFIDFIDVEFCLRAITNGYTIHAVCDAVLFHELGKRKKYKVLGFEVRPMFHPPERKFYLYRNRKKVWKKYLFKVPSFVLYDILAGFYDVIRVIVFEDKKMAKLKMIIKGLVA